ncbi:MAG: type I DNA topoisomerase, partial [Nitrospirota bacterium]
DAKLFKISSEKAEIKNESEAENILKDLDGKFFVAGKIEIKNKKRFPSPPFITSTLQQEAARKLKFTANRTMIIAQQLYEGLELGSEGSVGIITYMRTDSVRVSSEAQQEARKFIANEFGKDCVPEKSPVYKSKKSAQEAHEAIRPTSVLREPRNIKQYLAPEQYRLYKLIWKRFLASQMSPALLEQTSVDIGADKYTFRASGTVVKFPSFISLYTESADETSEEDKILPSLKEGDALKTIAIMPKQHFTQPPPRYTEASLVKELEAKGIGRPSTYAAILSTIQKRRYTEKSEGRFNPTELGVVVTDLLIERFPGLMDIGFTAKMEENLDEIEEATSKWVKVVKDFYVPFNKELEEAVETVGKVKPKDIATDQVCEKCGKPMVIKWGRHGRFMACSGFPECKNAKPLEGQESGVKGQGSNAEVQQTDEKCPKCGSPMVIKSGRFGRFIACSKYPECKTTKPISMGIKCPEDGGEIVERRTKRGKIFFSCGNYPKCKFATWYRPVSKSCPDCGAGILVEKRTKKEQSLSCIKKGCNYKEELPDKTEQSEEVSL